MIAARIEADMRMALVAWPACGRSVPATPQDLTARTCIDLRMKRAGGLYARELEKPAGLSGVPGVLRAHQPPLLAVWGKHDPAFVPAGAPADRTDLPNTNAHLLDTGHFALETHAAAIAQIIGAFLPRALQTAT